MDYIAADNAIITYFGTAWAARCPVAYPDVAFGIPKPADTPSKKGEWVRMTVQNYNGFQSSVGSPGSNRHDRNGMITFQCFCPENTGGKMAKQRANEIVDLYLSLINSGIKYFDTSQKEIGNDGSGFFQVNVTTYFRFEDFA